MATSQSLSPSQTLPDANIDPSGEKERHEDSLIAVVGSDQFPTPATGQIPELHHAPAHGEASVNASSIS